MRRHAALLLMVALAGTTSCGGGSRDAEGVVDAAAAGLGKVHSGTLDIRLLVTPRGVSGGAFGLRLAGPFALSNSGPLPIARIRYTQIAGGQEGSATVISTGRSAFVQAAGTAYRLSPAQSKLLRGITGSNGSGLEGLKLHFSRWLRNPRLFDGSVIDGVRADRVTGTLDAPAAFTDLLAATHHAGHGRAISPRTAKRLDAAVRASSVTLWSGRKDGLLRRLRVRLNLATPPELRSLTGGLRSIHLALDVRLSRLNRPVHVTAPANSQPASALSAAASGTPASASG